MKAADEIISSSLMNASKPWREQGMLDAHTTRSSGSKIVAGAGTVMVHVALVALATFIGTRTAKRETPVPVTQMIEIDLAPPAEPSPMAPEPSASLPPQPAIPRSVPQVAKKISAAAPPPEAAQAAKVLEAPEDVVDLTDQGIVQGTGSAFAGGLTDAKGSESSAVHGPSARAGGVPGGSGTGSIVDLSRPPRLAGGAEWDCPFPAEAEDAGVDHATVTLRVEVGIDGRVTRATPSTDPGHGFAREARLCALGKPWSPGQDRAGRPCAATAVVNVRFER